MDRDDTEKRRESTPHEKRASIPFWNPRRIFPSKPPNERAERHTEDEELLNRRVPSIPRANAPELAAFTHSDPWRVLRIQGEFVQGIDALAGVGAAIAVFGSARFGPET